MRCLSQLYTILFHMTNCAIMSAYFMWIVYTKFLIFWWSAKNLLGHYNFLRYYGFQHSDCSDNVFCHHIFTLAKKRHCYITLDLTLQTPVEYIRMDLSSDVCLQEQQKLKLNIKSYFYKFIYIRIKNFVKYNTLKLKDSALIDFTTCWLDWFRWTQHWIIL